MYSSLWICFALSLDSAVAGFGLSPLVSDRPAQLQLAAWFGLCDMLGSMIAGSGPISIVQPLLPLQLVGFGLMGVAAIMIAGADAWRRPALLTLPVLLSIDNLIVSLPAGIPWFHAAAIAGVSSMMSALAGLYLGAWLRRSLSNATSETPLINAIGVGCPVTAATILFFF